MMCPSKACPEKSLILEIAWLQRNEDRQCLIDSPTKQHKLTFNRC